jgi:hypothetical protein
MPETLKPYETITDYASGRDIPLIGPEENRQKVERFLVEAKGYAREDIEIDVDLELNIGGERWQSQVDLVLSVDGTRAIAFKCVAASIGSREREIVSAARLLDENQIPFAVVSDGENAVVLDTISGKKIGQGLEAIPMQAVLQSQLRSMELQPFPEEKRDREKLIFRTYDMENVNVLRRK